MELFYTIRVQYSGRVPPAVSPKGFRPILPAEDASAAIGKADSVSDSVNGLSVIIEYRDAKGAPSLRQISCVHIEMAKAKRYLRAFCHQRRALRIFQIERIHAVLDAETGEVLGSGKDFFEQFTDDRISGSALGWGLSPIQRADLGAGLTVLTFLSRCDGKIHPAEMEEVDTFTAAWWMRAEIKHDIPESDIAAYARRLAPDVEAFVLAAQRVWSSPIVAPLIAGYARRVVEADGVIAVEERHWIGRLVEWFNRERSNA